jgi:hypothetical protein
MPATSLKSASKSVDDVARLLTQAVDPGITHNQVEEFIDELSQLLWAASSLDPDDDQLRSTQDMWLICSPMPNVEA